MQSTEELITIPLKDYVRAVLGHTQLFNQRPIPSHIAEIIIAKTKNSRLCYIQLEDELGNQLESPVLWDFKSWKDSQELWEKQKAYSHRQRVARFILDANVRRVKKVLIEYMEPEFAEATAYQLCAKRAMGKLAVFGITKLIEREEEL